MHRDGISTDRVRAYRANVTRIHLFQALTNLSLWMPIWIVFLQVERHLTLTQLTTMTGISWFMMAMAEVPTGAVADAYGRKFSVMVGTVMVGLGTILFGILPSYWGIMGAFFVWSTGLALNSGADMALLYDSMKSAGDEEAYPKMAGRSFAIIQFAQGAASVAGGLIASWMINLPMLLAGGFALVALFVLSGVQEPPETKSARRNYFQTLSDAARFLREHRLILYLMAFTATFGGIAWAVTFVLFQPYMVTHTVHVAWVGILFMILRVAGTLGSMYGPRLFKSVAAPLWLLGVPAIFVAAFSGLMAARVWWIGFGLMVLVGFLHGAFRPSLSHLLNQRVSTEVRATLLSLQSLVFSLFIAGIQPVLGALTDIWGLVSAFLVLGVFSVGLLLLRVFWQREEARLTTQAETAGVGS